jgi:hypothetical protein
MRTGTLGTFKVLLFRISGRTEQERTFTLFLSVFKGVAGVLILFHITAPLLIHFSFDMHKANRKQHTGESGTLGETQKGEAMLTE